MTLNDKPDPKGSSSGKNYNETWWFPVLLIIISVIISSAFSYILFQNQWSNSIKTEQKNLANGYISDLEVVQYSIDQKLSAYNDNSSPNYHSPQKFTDNIYPDWGLYYSNRQDISKFKPELSLRMYKFYYVLLKAEEQRKEFNNFENLYPISQFSPNQRQYYDTERVKIFNSMINKTEICKDIIPELKSELQYVANT